MNSLFLPLPPTSRLLVRKAPTTTTDPQPSNLGTVALLRAQVVPSDPQAGFFPESSPTPDWRDASPAHRAAYARTLSLTTESGRYAVVS